MTDRAPDAVQVAVLDPETLEPMERVLVPFAEVSSHSPDASGSAPIWWSARSRPLTDAHRLVALLIALVATFPTAPLQSEAAVPAILAATYSLRRPPNLGCMDVHRGLSGPPVSYNDTTTIYDAAGRRARHFDASECPQHTRPTTTTTCSVCADRSP